jgi:hypothetical protein
VDFADKNYHREIVSLWCSSALDVGGVFILDATVYTGIYKNEEFVVFSGGVLLLWKGTAERLGVLKVGLWFQK